MTNYTKGYSRVSMVIQALSHGRIRGHMPPPFPIPSKTNSVKVKNLTPSPFTNFQ